MRLTSKGYKVPETDDKDFWSSIVFDIERLNSHTHDDLDSERLSPGAVEPYAVTVQVADWVGGSAPYYFDVEFPLGWNMTWNDGEPCPVQIVVRDASENQVLLDTTRMAAGLGVRVYSSVKAIYVVGMY